MPSETFDPSAEAKYAFSLGDAPALTRALHQLCVVDPKYAGGRITSAYFDTADRRYLADKINSDFLKTKVRLRWYGDVASGDPADPVHAFLERKEKIGSRRIKERHPIQVPRDALTPGTEDYRLLGRLVDRNGFADWVPPETLFPMIVITYWRHRFLDITRTARLALDTRIGYSSVNSVFFPATGSRVAREGVLEVKSPTGELPRELRPLRTLLRTRDSFSKYETCWQLHADTGYRRDQASQGVY